MPERRKSAWAVITNLNGDYLLLRRSKTSNNPGLFNFPGGSIDPGEEPRASAIRELKEEAGITYNNLTFARVILSEKVNMFFYEHQFKKPIKIQINNESDKFGWYSKDAIKKLPLHPPTKKFMGL